jgi:hypothetical protein
MLEVDDCVLWVKDEAATCFEAGVEVATCSEAGDEAMVCFGGGIEDGRWQQRSSVSLFLIYETCPHNACLPSTCVHIV